jgi:chromate transporter
MVFREWKELPAVEAVFKGIRPAVVALIAAPLVKMAKTAVSTHPSSQEKTCRNALPLLISLTAALLIWLGHVNPVWVIAATIVLTLVIIDIMERRKR